MPAWRLVLPGQPTPVPAPIAEPSLRTHRDAEAASDAELWDELGDLDEITEDVDDAEDQL